MVTGSASMPVSKHRVYDLDIKNNYDHLVFYAENLLKSPNLKTEHHEYRDAKTGEIYHLYINDVMKYCKSESYHCLFFKNTGETYKWGKTFDDDPNMSPIGPEILDLEISVNGCPTIKGVCCSHCYKSNTNGSPYNMNISEFRQLMDKMPKSLNQIAFGITGTKTNPHFIDILRTCRLNYGVIPNYTLSGADLEDDVIDATQKYCGGVAVSCYPNAKDLCYNTIFKLKHKPSHLVVNMHLLLSKDNMGHIMEVLNDIKSKEPRLKGLVAVVFLRIKPIGRATELDCDVTQDMVDKLLEFCYSNNISHGFDSCGASMAMEYYSKRGDDHLLEYCETCESSCFSSYINAYGEYHHCSFIEHSDIDLGEPINVLECNDFLTDVWFSPQLDKFRGYNRKCPILDKVQ